MWTCWQHAHNAQLLLQLVGIVLRVACMGMVWQLEHGDLVWRAPAHGHAQAAVHHRMLLQLLVVLVAILGPKVMWFAHAGVAAGRVPHMYTACFLF